jgi:hypothetical protein
MGYIQGLYLKEVKKNGLEKILEQKEYHKESKCPENGL